MASSDKSFYTPHKEKLKLKIYRRAKFLPRSFYKTVLPRSGSYRSLPSGIYVGPSGEHAVYLYNDRNVHWYLVDANDRIGQSGRTFRLWDGPDITKVCMTRVNYFNELTGDAAGEYGICMLLSLAAKLFFESYLLGTPGVSEEARLATICILFGSDGEFKDFEEMDTVTVNMIRRGDLNRTGNSELRLVANAYCSYYDVDGSVKTLFDKAL